MIFFWFRNELTPEEIYASTEWCLPGEEWKAIPGYDYYEASTFGRIRSLDRYKVARPDHKTARLFRGRVLQPQITETGYYAVLVRREGEKRQFRKVHRLVIETFIPNTDNLPCINHKDENRYNNRIENLEWCSHQYNVTYGTARKRAAVNTRKFYEQNGRRVVQYDLNGKFIKEYPCIAIAIEQTGISNIGNCCAKRYDSAGGYVFRYKGDAFSYTPTPINYLPILCYTVDGQFVKEYASMRQVTEELGLKTTSSILHVLKGRNKTCCGFVWKYKNK